MGLPAGKDERPESDDFIARGKMEFTRRLLSLRLREQFGHMADDMYMGPEFPGDKVDGAGKWVKYLDEQVGRSSVAAQLAKRGAEILPRYVTEPVALAFLGIGDAIRFKQNDLTLTQKFTKVVAASAYDSSPIFIKAAISELDARRAQFTRPGGVLHDIFDSFDIPGNGKTGRSRPTKVATSFGRTFFNLEGSIERGLPTALLRERFRTIRKAVGKGGFLAIEYAEGPLKEEDYNPQIPFAANLAERINRDAPREYHVNTSQTSIRFQYHHEYNVMGHYITLHGAAWADQEFHYNSTWTTRDDVLLPIARSAGWKSVFHEDIEEINVAEEQRIDDRETLNINGSKLGLFMAV